MPRRVVPQPAIDLLPYQRRWLADSSRFKIAMYARQTGKTFMATYEIAEELFTSLAQGQRVTWYILSAGERQAKAALQQVKYHCEAFQMAHAALKNVAIAIDLNALEVRFPNGSKGQAIPANANTVRGLTGHLYFDEVAFWPDAAEIWRAASPIATRGYKIRMTSTPNGKGNLFYQMWTAQDGDWSHHRTDIYDACKDGLNVDITALKRALNDDDAWAQEYELQWLDEASAWLSYDLINGCEDDAATVAAPLATTVGRVYLGVDIGTRHDLFVIWVLEAVGDVLWTREVIAKQRISFAEQDALLDDCFRRYPVSRCCMDQTGMGEKPVEDAQRRHGSSRVEGVLFTGASKQHLATLAKDAFEDRKVRIPKGVREIREDLHKLQKVTSPTGAPRFIADRDSDGHADRAWALFLALNAASSPPEVFEYHPIQRRSLPSDAGESRRSLRDSIAQLFRRPRMF